MNYQAISRRAALLGGMSGLAAVSLAACSTRSSAAAPVSGGSAPVKGPSAAWNGPGGSGFGGTLPTDVTRTVAKPALRWNVAPFERVSANHMILVEADALGGIDHVDLLIEGNTVRAADWNIYTDTDVNGVARTRSGYAVVLDVDACLAKSPSNNAVYIYARAYPKNPLFQTRTIGPLILYPEITLHDFVKTIALNGTGDYTSIYAALNAARTANAKSPLFTFTQTGFYDWANGDWSSYTGKGYCVFQGAAGVLATVGRASFPGALAPGSFANAKWDIWTSYNGIELRGNRIVLDNRNFVFLRNGNGSATDPVPNHRLNGIKVTNSAAVAAGTPYIRYWNKGSKPQGLLSPQPYQLAYSMPGAVWNGITFSGWNGGGILEDSIFEYGDALVMNTDLCRGNKLHKCYERLWNGGMACFDNYSDENNIIFWHTAVGGLSITYTDVGAATAQVNNINDFILKVDGVTKKDFQLTAQPSAADGLTVFFNVGDIVNYINSNANGQLAGWHATLNDVTDPCNATQLGTQRAGGGPVVIGDILGPAGMPVTTVNATPLVIPCHEDIHAGGGNFYAPGKLLENLIWRNNIALNIDSDGAHAFTDILFDPVAALNDFVFDGQIWQGGNSLLLSTADASPLYHVVFTNCVTVGFGVSYSRQASWTWTNDPYSSFVNCVFTGNATQAGAYAQTGLAFPSYPNLVNCFAPGISANSPPSTWTGNFGTAYNDSIFVDAANKDYRPAGVLLAHLKPRLGTKDISGTTRAASDAVGAFAALAPRPSWLGP